MQSCWVTQGSLEKLELLLPGARRLRTQLDGYHRVIGPEIFQVRLDQSKEQRNGVGWFRNLKPMFVVIFVGKGEP
jgi:hypothetical protein